MGRRGVTGSIDLPRGVVQRGGSTYRRFKVKDAQGKWKDHYVKLPDPLSPLFAEKLAEVNGKAIERAVPGYRTIAALIAEFRPVLKDRRLAPETRRAWHYYLDLIEEQHGKGVVSELKRSRVYKIRDSMGATPGKANAYISKFRALLDFAIDRDWITVNPADGVTRLEGGEYEPWPAEVLEAALNKASPMVRLAIVCGLYSGQRISDLIRMQHGWHDGRIMEVSASQKTQTYTPIPMAPEWIAEIKKLPRKAVTILYDRSGKPFADTDRLQASLRRLMRDLGFVGDDGVPLYTFHGLGKNACCYLAEQGLSDTEISAVTGKTPETVRHYAKRARAYMIALGAADRVTAGNRIRR